MKMLSFMASQLRIPNLLCMHKVSELTWPCLLLKLDNSSLLAAAETVDIPMYALQTNKLITSDPNYCFPDSMTKLPMELRGHLERC